MDMKIVYFPRPLIRGKFEPVNSWAGLKARAMGFSV
jgi:hypothetical protein